jgi:hypothetical protein
MLYYLFHKNGKPITAQSITNFDKQVFRDGKNKCWIWKGYKHKNGYGYFTWRFGGNSYKQDAHRFSYMIYVGDVQRKLCVCHTCDRKECVNPNHLWTGTHKENTADMMRKGRYAKKFHYGEKNPNSKLTKKDVLYIRSHFKKRIVTAEMLSKKFGVKKGTIWAVHQKTSWKNIP